MSDYWLSTKSPADMFRTAEYQNFANDKVIVETQFIDAALVAQDMKIGAHQVRAYRRKLGIRASDI